MRKYTQQVFKKVRCQHTYRRMNKRIKEKKAATIRMTNISIYCYRLDCWGVEAIRIPSSRPINYQYIINAEIYWHFFFKINVYSIAKILKTSFSISVTRIHPHTSHTHKSTQACTALESARAHTHTQTYFHRFLYHWTAGLPR